MPIANLKNKTTSYCISKIGFIRKQQRTAIQDKQVMAKPLASLENKRKEMLFYREKGDVGKKVINKKSTGVNWQFKVFWPPIG